ncbi:type IV pilus secretin family protein [Azovibrio restrictus]|uniref:type IV pilus secretin family protein n=1 Tax=Azovibrio restrictus TaxID=146938 RepID=UPI0026F36F2A|nr:type IV pilus secretin family protein [Azovibrio restrictus]
MKKLDHIKYLLLCLMLGAVSLVQAQGAQTAAGNAIQKFEVAKQGQDILIRFDLKEPLASPPVGFSIANPSRLAFDFTGVANQLGKNSHAVNEGDLTGINVVQVGDRTRVVLNLVRNLNYSTRVDGNALLVTLSPMVSTARDGGRIEHFAREAMPEAKHAVRDIAFRRGKDGEGRVIVDLADAGTGIDIRQQGKELVVDFLKTDLPENLRRKLDVTDFATPVTSITTEKNGANVRMTIVPKGLWEHNAYQAENQFVVEVRPIVEDPNKLVQGSKIGYQGPRISINYQNGDVRALLRLMAEELGLNAVISETVTGTTTLVLKDVPADQVIDIIFQQKGLDMRKNGNVILIAPRDEISTREKLEFESKQQTEDLEPMRTESFQINYQKAQNLQKLLTDKEQRMLSKRGSAVVDERTNVLFVQDVPSRLEQVRKVIAQVDIPVRQVMIEARIVEATDQFAKNLGARLGISGKDKYANWGGQNQLIAGDAYMKQLTSQGFVTGQQMTWRGPEYKVSPEALINNLNQVNLPATGYKGVSPTEFSFILFNAAKTKFLNLEISALEADLKGKVVSSPRVLTSDQTKARIEQGVEVPYLEASSSGATSVVYRKAVLALEVTPHITPDGKVSMKLKINKDAIGAETRWGAIIETKKVETDVLVDNGGTIVIGGIYEIRTRDDVNKVPLLGDLPVIGYAFKNTSRQNEKTELLVFITPRIVSETVALR